MDECVRSGYRYWFFSHKGVQLVDNEWINELQAAATDLNRYQRESAVLTLRADITLVTACYRYIEG